METTTTRTPLDQLAWTLIAGMGEDEPVDAALLRANRAGREWDWQGARDAIEEAYRAVGSEAPAGIDHGYAWHCGTHPIQVRARELREAHRI